MSANGTFPFTAELISIDGSPNVVVRALWRITISATGEVTSLIDRVDVVCV